MTVAVLAVASFVVAMVLFGFALDEWIVPEWRHRRLVYRIRRFKKLDDAARDLAARIANDLRMETT